MSCPITRTAYCLLREYALARDSLYGEIDARELDEVGAQTLEDTPSNLACVLRAFYAIEVQYSVLLPTRTAALKFNARRRELANLRAPRSPEGLFKVISTLRSVHRAVVVDAAETSLIGDYRSARHMATMVDALAQSIERGVRASTCLLDYLEGRTKDLKPVGVMFGEELPIYEGVLDGVLSHMHTLLSINEENPVYVWNTTTKYQA